METTLKPYCSLIMVVLLCWLQGYEYVAAQAACDDFPGNYTPPANQWDWRDFSYENWYAYVKSQDQAGDCFEKILCSPFGGVDICSSESFYNVGYLSLDGSDKADFQPEDGWVLLYKYFGEPSVQCTKGVEHPSFALYNRFNGLARFFTYVRNVDEAQNSGALRLRYPFSTNGIGISSPFISSIFEENAAVFTRTLDAFQKSEIFDLNEFRESVSIGDNGIWFMTTIPTSYDPCVCESVTINDVPNQYYRSFFAVEPIVIKNTTLTQEGTYTENLPQDLIADGAAKPNALGGIISLAMDSRVSAQKVFKSTQSATQAIAPYLASSAPNIQTACPPLDLPPEAAAAGSSALSTAIPIIAGVGAFASSFIMGGKKFNQNANRVVPVKSYNMKTTGLLEQKIGLKGPLIYTPGSKEQITNSAVIVPEYNYRLGILNILETPKIEYVDYEHNGSSLSTVGFRRKNMDVLSLSDSSYTEYEVINPTVVQYRLKEPLKVVVNPASQLELVSLEQLLLYKIPHNVGKRGIDSLGAAFITEHESIVAGDMDFVVDTNLCTFTNYCYFGPLDVCVLDHDHYLPAYGPVVTTPIDYDQHKTFIDRMAQSGIRLDLWPKDNNTDNRGSYDISKMVFATSYAPSSCYDQQSFLLANYNNYRTPVADKDFWHYKPEIYVRYKAILKRTDPAATPATELVMQVATIRVPESNIVKSNLDNGSERYGYVQHTPSICEAYSSYRLLVSTGGYTEVERLNLLQQFFPQLIGRLDEASYDCWYKEPAPNEAPGSTAKGNLYMKNYHFGNFSSDVNPNGLVFPSGTNGKPLPQSNLTVSNITISSDQTFYATNELIVGPNVIIEPGVKVEFVGGVSVVVVPGTELTPDATIRIGSDPTFDACRASPVLASQASVSQFCKNPLIYRPINTAIAKVGDENRELENKSVSETLNTSISLYPNPTTGMFTLQVGGGDGTAGARAVVWNALGQRVVPGVAVPESGRLELDLRTEAAGVYLVQVVGSTGAVLGSTRLAVQR